MSPLVVSKTATGIKRQVQIATVSLDHNHDDIALAKARIAELKKQKSATSTLDQSLRRAKLDFSSVISDLSKSLEDLRLCIKEESGSVAFLSAQYRQIADIAVFMDKKVEKLETDVGHNISHRKWFLFCCQFLDL